MYGPINTPHESILDFSLHYPYDVCFSLRAWHRQLNFITLSYPTAGVKNCNMLISKMPGHFDTTVRDTVSESLSICLMQSETCLSTQWSQRSLSYDHWGTVENGAFILLTSAGNEKATTAMTTAKPLISQTTLPSPERKHTNTTSDGYWFPAQGIVFSINNCNWFELCCPSKKKNTRQHDQCKWLHNCFL